MTVSGSGFPPGASLTIGGVPAGNIQVVDSFTNQGDDSPASCGHPRRRLR